MKHVIRPDESTLLVGRRNKRGYQWCLIDVPSGRVEAWGHPVGSEKELIASMKKEEQRLLDWWASDEWKSLRGDES